MKRELAAAVIGMCLGAGTLHAEDDAARAQRWHDLAHALFGGRTVADGSAFLHLQAPARAEDAALVPIAIQSSAPTPIKGLYLVIDDNPAPMAGHFSFGPAGDPAELRLRVRVDQYTLMHAVAETQDGHLYGVSAFVKAAGGCSAPAGASEAEALRGMGQMKLRTLAGYAGGKPLQAQLLIRHPNFNGMQMNQVTRLYTAARFVNAVDVSYAGTPVFHLDSDISMSTDPAITFSFLPHAPGQLSVVVRDSTGAVFTHSFDVPAQGS